MSVACHAHFWLLDFITKLLVRSINHDTPHYAVFSRLLLLSVFKVLIIFLITLFLNSSAWVLLLLKC
jgi:hypothetical protein